MDINMFFELSLAGAFMYWNCGRDVYKKDIEQKETIKKLREIGEIRKQKEVIKDQEIESLPDPSNPKSPKISIE